MAPSRRLFVVLAAAPALALAGCASEPSPAATASATPARIALPAGAAAYFFGDSWTEGHSAASGQGYPFVVGCALGWAVTRGPDGSGTGYVHVNASTGRTYPQRAAALPARITADIVVLQGSINDEPGPFGGYDTAVARTVSLLRQRTGGAPIVLLGPAPASSPVAASLVRIDGLLAAQARRLRLPYISPVQGDWINSANVPTLIDAATGHPNTVGHAYFGGRVAAELAALVTTAAAA